MGTGMVLGWLLLLAIVVVVIIGAVAAARLRSPASRAPSPEDILRQRYARGEVDDQELRRRLQELRRH